LNFQKTPVPTPRFKRKTEVVKEETNSPEEKQNNNNKNKKMQNNFKYHFNPAQNLSQDSGLSPSPYDLNFRNLPPPLPPKKSSITKTGLTSPVPPSNVFQPSLLVRTPSNSSGINNNGPNHLVATPSNRRNQQRHRVEAKRNSIVSSDEEDEEHFQIHRHSLINPQRTSRVDLSQTSIIMNEPFPPELDFSQVVGQSQFNATQPPPPPPRDPKRKLYLSPGPDSRPVSYSFEKPDLVQKTPTPYINPITSQQMNNEINQASPIINRCRPIIRETRQGRAASAPSYFSHSVTDLTNSVPDLVRPMEYWKSPPLPFVPTYDPYLPPPRPPRPNLKKKLSDTSSRGRDSAIGPSPLNGKSSPSSSSVTSSRDSGYPPQLSAVLEQNSPDMNTMTMKLLIQLLKMLKSFIAIMKKKSLKW